MKKYRSTPSSSSEDTSPSISLRTRRSKTDGKKRLRTTLENGGRGSERKLNQISCPVGGCNKHRKDKWAIIRHINENHTEGDIKEIDESFLVRVYALGWYHSPWMNAEDVVSF
jgi:hypothetical protein